MSYLRRSVDDSVDKEELRILLIEKEVNAEIERQKKRFRPDSLEELVQNTKFSRKEVQLLYRGFKEDCPNGIVTREKFLEIFETFFPYGGCTNYANFVFNTFDGDGNGEISFEEFVKGLSVLSRGSEEDKILWIFQLYDTGAKGFIAKPDMLRIITAVYEILGNRAIPPITFSTVAEHANFIFDRMDENSDGRITEEEFLQCCKQDANILQSMELFRTIYNSGS